jgi:hypothetical protein
MTTAFAPIRYNARQVALMIQVALLYAPNSIMDATGLSRREVNAMAAQRIAPTKAVLDYLRLTVDGEEYVWDPAMDYKIPCWGPVLTKPRDAVISNGAAIRHAVRTVESSFVDR